MNSIVDIQHLVLEYCKNSINETMFNVWLKDLVIDSYENDTVTLLASNQLIRKTVSEKCMNLLHEAFVSVLGFDVNIEIIVPSEQISEVESYRTSLEAYKRREFTFDNFIVGSSNKFAYAAAKAVANEPGGNSETRINSYNPLFIYGNSGLGKTHLLNAICHDVRKNFPEMTILYTRGEDFANEFISHIETKSTDVFHEKYRNIDLFLIDDIQFIAGKKAIQEEFFHTFDALITVGKQVVLTSDRPPREIQSLEERLRSRFEWGLLADLQSPDYETRVAILRRKAQLIDFNVPNDVIEFIAEKIKTNIRQLEGTIKKLQAKNAIENQQPTIMLAQSIIKEILTDNQPLPVTISRIVSEVSRTTGISSEDIYSNKRNASITKARKITLYAVREITSLSYELIGEEFDKHYSTVMYNVEQTQKEIESDSAFAAMVNDLIKNIKDSRN